MNRGRAGLKLGCCKKGQVYDLEGFEVEQVHYNRRRQKGGVGCARPAEFAAHGAVPPPIPCSSRYGQPVGLNLTMRVVQLKLPVIS